VIRRVSHANPLANVPNAGSAAIPMSGSCHRLSATRRGRRPRCASANGWRNASRSFDAILTVLRAIRMRRAAANTALARIRAHISKNEERASRSQAARSFQCDDPVKSFFAHDPSGRARGHAFPRTGSRFSGSCFNLRTVRWSACAATLTWWRRQLVLEFALAFVLAPVPAPGSADISRPRRDRGA
jgi:hypothetical protein